MKRTYRNLLNIIKATLLDTPVKVYGEFDYNEIFDLSKKHKIIPLVFTSLYKHYGDIPEIEKFRNYTYQAVFHDQNQLYFINEIEKIFSANNIDYMLLKGASIKKYYPAPETRLMGDVDILIKEEQYKVIKKILPQLGLHEMKETDHELNWCNNSGILIELHKKLIPSYNDDYYKYYSEPWGKAYSRNGNGFSMLPEDEYIYMFTHMTKHYRDGGIGLRHIIDLYVFSLKHPMLNMKYIEKELKKLDLDIFYKNILETINVWFNEKQETKISDYITDRIIESGAYGIKEKWDLANASRVSSSSTSVSVAKSKSIILLIFMPFSSMKKKYPVLNKIPILLPLMWVVRWIDAIINKRDNISRHSERITKIDKTLVEGYNKELEMVGLKFEQK